MAEAQSRRKSDKRKRAHLIAVRLTDDELARLATAASLADVSVATYLRASGLKRPLRNGRVVGDVAHAPADLRRLLGEVNKIGSNLNQIARAANIAANAGREANTSALDDALAELGEVRAELRRALGVAS